MLRSTLLGLVAPTLLSLAAIACGGAGDDPSAPVEDEGALAKGGAAKGTVLVTAKGEDGSTAELSFALREKAGKRVAVMAIDRGTKHDELECSQLANLNADAKKDEIVTLCEEQTKPGSVYVSVYVRFFPGTNKLSMDVIASNPDKLTKAQSDLYTLVSGLPVKTPPPPAAHPDWNHREQTNELPLTAKRMGTDPFGDPIALGAATRDGLRGPLGATVHDTKGSHPGDFVVNRLTAYTEFNTFLYPFDVQGQGVGGDQTWHSRYGMKVSVADAQGTPKLVPAADVTKAMRDAVTAP